MKGAVFPTQTSSNVFFSLLANQSIIHFFAISQSEYHLIFLPQLAEG